MLDVFFKPNTVHIHLWSGKFASSHLCQRGDKYHSNIFRTCATPYTLRAMFCTSRNLNSEPRPPFMLVDAVFTQYHFYSFIRTDFLKISVNVCIHVTHSYWHIFSIGRTNISRAICTSIKTTS